MKKLIIAFLICIIAGFVIFKIVTASKSVQSRIDLPTSQPTKVDTLDRSYLRIALHSHQFKISLFDKSFVTGKVDSLGVFINSNKIEIDKNKILFIGNEKTEEFKAVVLLLRNNDIYRFQINAE